MVRADASHGAGVHVLQPIMKGGYLFKRSKDGKRCKTRTSYRK
jgi:hypothetical protein